MKEGRILLDGIDIRDYAVDKVRNAVSVSSQKTMLFSGSIRDNIAWSSPEMSPERVESAAQAAQAEEFILSMQEGYKSSIYQGAVNLSGGQKQRVSIARALAKESQLLILDDSTSALDAVTDRKVREAIKEFKPRRTTILITQRIGTAMGADKILVLSQGKMEGFGTHEDLMKNSSTYRDLYVSQIGELDKAVM